MADYYGSKHQVVQNNGLGYQLGNLLGSMGANRVQQLQDADYYKQQALQAQAEIDAEKQKQSSMANFSANGGIDSGIGGGRNTTAIDGIYNTAQANLNQKTADQFGMAIDPTNAQKQAKANSPMANIVNFDSNGQDIQPNYDFKTPSLIAQPSSKAVQESQSLGSNANAQQLASVMPSKASIQSENDVQRNNAMAKATLSGGLLGRGMSDIQRKDLGSHYDKLLDNTWSEHKSNYIQKIADQLKGDRDAGLTPEEQMTHATTLGLKAQQLGIMSLADARALAESPDVHEEKSVDDNGQGWTQKVTAKGTPIAGSKVKVNLSEQEKANLEHTRASTDNVISSTANNWAMANGTGGHAPRGTGTGVAQTPSSIDLYVAGKNKNPKKQAESSAVYSELLKQASTMNYGRDQQEVLRQAYEHAKDAGIPHDTMDNDLSYIVNQSASNARANVGQQSQPASPMASIIGNSQPSYQSAQYGTESNDTMLQPQNRTVGSFFENLFSPFRNNASQYDEYGRPKQ